MHWVDNDGLLWQETWIPGGEMYQITEIFPDPLNELNATGKESFHPLLHLPYSLPTQSFNWKKKDASHLTRGWHTDPPVGRSHSLAGKDNAKDTKN